MAAEAAGEPRRRIGLLWRGDRAADPFATANAARLEPLMAALRRRREGVPWWAGLIGAAILIGYGVIPTLHRSTFGRVYAAYGGVFVVMSLLWGWGLDGHRPHRFDWIGAGIVAVGVGVIFAPRH
jgi:small multidrug resistance family-3 protein